MAEIELVKPEFLAGSEKRLFNFIKDLSDKDKVAIFSHTDVDGIVAAKIVNQVIGADIIRFMNYSEINDDLLKWIKEKKINKIFMSDISFPDRKFLRRVEKLAKVVIVDHHTFKEDLNTEKSVFINAQGFCASYLCYYLFSRTQNLENYDWLVVCASLYDWLYEKNRDWMKKVYEKYGERFDLSEKHIKNSRFWKLQYDISLASLYFDKDLEKVFNALGANFGDIGNLPAHAKEVDSEIVRSISDFYVKKEDIKEGCFMEFDSRFPVEAIVVNLLSAGTPNKTFIVCQKEGNYIKVSARRQDGKINLPELLRNLVQGFDDSTAGGHIKAAGASLPIKHMDEFRKRLKSL